MNKIMKYAMLGFAVIAAIIISLAYKAPLNYVPQVYQTYTEGMTLNSFPYSFDYHTEEEITEQPTVQIHDPKEYPNGYSWLISKVSDGSPGMKYTTYRTTYDADNNPISQVYVPDSMEIVPAEPILYSYGASPSVGAYFVSDWVTSYGVNCVGCHISEDGVGGTSAGISLSLTSVRQSDGSWKEGITYDGYYIIAADKGIPLCTVVEISNHRFSGKGLEPGVPFKAIVLDRGGAITGNDIDLFTGDERASGVNNGRRRGVKVEILDFGSWTKNSQGQRMCRV